MRLRGVFCQALFATSGGHDAWPPKCANRPWFFANAFPQNVPRDTTLYLSTYLSSIVPCPERGDQRTEDRGIGPRGFKNTHTHPKKESMAEQLAGGALCPRSGAAAARAASRPRISPGGRPRVELSPGGRVPALDACLRWRQSSTNKPGGAIGNGNLGPSYVLSRALSSKMKDTGSPDTHV